MTNIWYEISEVWNIFCEVKRERNKESNKDKMNTECVFVGATSWLRFLKINL